MSSINFIGMSLAHARNLQRGGVDANGQPAEQAISNGEGNPCRHCLEFIAKGEKMLIVSYRPFNTVQPYAEQGPVFLHADECQSYQKKGDELPEALSNKTSCIVRGYGSDERIVYGTGKVTPYEEIAGRSYELLANSEIEFIHIRSASNNCWQARVERG